MASIGDVDHPSAQATTVLLLVSMIDTEGSASGPVVPESVVMAHSHAVEARGLALAGR